MESNIKTAKTIMETILSQIATDYNLDNNTLLKYLDKEPDLHHITLVKKTPGTTICRARKQDGLRCTRRCKDETDFCGKHIKNQKYGCVQDMVKTDIITANQLYYNDITYLIDDDNIIYSQNDGQYEIVGKRMDTGKIRFIKDLINNQLLSSPPFFPAQINLKLPEHQLSELHC